MSVWDISRSYRKLVIKWLPRVAGRVSGEETEYTGRGQTIKGFVYGANAVRISSSRRVDEGFWAEEWDTQICIWQRCLLAAWENGSRGSRLEAKHIGEPLQKSRWQSRCAPTKAVTVGMELKDRQFGELLEWENWQNLGANKMWKMRGERVLGSLEAFHN